MSKVATTMRLFRTVHGPVLEMDGTFRPLPDDWDALVDRDRLEAYLRECADRGPGQPRLDAPILAPVGSQEVWAAGVTYVRSRSARMEESKDSGGGTFYDRVYSAARPELFFKAVAWRARGPEQSVRIRRDSQWNVPEPELALCINSRGEIIGYTIANDMSSRDIEGENPLYLPQAKIYDGGCALGPALLVRSTPLPAATAIALRIERLGTVAFEGATTLSQMRRTGPELVEYLYRETSFPRGCVLLTGTGVVPPDSFTLRSGDEIRIDIAPIGTLVNRVE
ncbi:MAG TPA: fumarylacetoacetate hydrolase family protein [Gemmatimonadaceae bacterium]